MTNQKTIIITGGTKGLGKALCTYLSRNKYNIATFSSNTIEKESDNFLQSQVDIRDKQKVKAFIDRVYKKWQRIDILINNAGIVNLKCLKDYTEEDVNNTVDVNIKGTFFVTQATIPYMHDGYVINIGSTRSITGAPNKSIYSMSKFAMRSLTQCINQEIHNVRSTIICPGKFEPEGYVSIQYLCKTIKLLINTPSGSSISELIIGGQL